MNLLKKILMMLPKDFFNNLFKDGDNEVVIKIKKNQKGKIIFIFNDDEVSLDEIKNGKKDE